MTKNLITTFVLLIGVVIFGYFVYQNFSTSSKKNNKNISFIPNEDAILVLETNKIQEKIQHLFTTNLIWKELSKNKNLTDFEYFWNSIDSVLDVNNIKLKETTLALLKHKNEIDYFFVSEFYNTINIDSLSKKNLNKENATIYSLTISNKKIYLTLSNNRLFCSNKKNKLLSIQPKNPLINNKHFTGIYKTKTKKNNEIALFTKLNSFPDFLNLKNNITLTNESWSAFDLKITQETLSGNGFISYAAPQNKYDLEYNEEFITTIPFDLNELTITNFNEFDDLNLNENIIKKGNQKCDCDYLFYALNWVDKQIIEFSVNNKNESYLAFKIDGTSAFNEGINYLSTTIKKTLVFNGITIKSVDSTINLAKLHQKNINLNYYITYKNYSFFGESLNSIKNLILALKTKKTLKSNSELYEFYNQNSNKNAFYKKIQKGFLFNSKLSNLGVSIWESSPRNEDLVYTNFSYSKEINIGENYAEPKWELPLEKILSSNIHFVKNHKINDIEIVVQDTSNTIYFVSTSGKLKWKKKLDRKIIGGIKTVDIYLNNKHQMLLNTPSKLYVIDVLGNDVKGFPKELPEATNEVNIIDYSNNKNYRFIVATSKGILSYDKLGNAVEGWTNPNPTHAIKTPIRHIVSNIKDYIFANDIKGNVFLFSRQGTKRHIVNPKFSNDYFPIDIGNDITSSRGIYLDKTTNTLKKHFFNNQKAITLLNTTDTILNFKYLDFDNNKEKDYILETKNSLLIYDKGGTIKANIKLPKPYKKLQILKDNIGFIDVLANSFVLLNKDGEEQLRIKDVESYKIDNSTNILRIILIKENKLRMVIPSSL